MPCHSEAIELNTFMRRDVRFLFGDRNLLLNRVNTFKIRQKKTSARAVLHNHTVFFNVQLGFRIDLFSR